MNGVKEIGPSVEQERALFKRRGRGRGEVAKEKDAERESLLSRVEWLWRQSYKAQDEMREAVREAAAAATREKQALALWHKAKDAVREYDRNKRTAKRTRGSNG